MRAYPQVVTAEIIDWDHMGEIPPDSLQMWFSKLLRAYWSIAHQFIERGMFPKPITAEYLSGLIATHFRATANSGTSAMKESLLSQSDFVSEDVWLLFTVDGVAEVIAGCDKNDSIWTESLIGLSNEGHISRARLLDESLAALLRHLDDSKGSWYSRFHEALRPTVEERKERLQSYLTLLASPAHGKTSFAASALLVINKENPLTFDELKLQIGNALTAKAKGTTLTALALLASCAKREPAQRAQIMALACTALVSEAAEVQTKALELMSEYADPDDDLLKENFGQYTWAILASVRSKIPKFLRDSKLPAQMVKQSPAEEERKKRLQSYLALLTGPAGGDVTYALSSLLKMDKTNPLKFDELKLQIGTALTAKAKGTALAALSLLANCAEREPAHRAEIMAQVCTALVSTSAEVQTKALELIAEYADSDDDSLKEAYGHDEGAILSSVRSKIPEFLLGTIQPAQVVKHPSEVEPSKVQHSAAHHEVIKAERALEPITSLDELILKASYVLENPEQIDNLELVLDGISRLCNERPADFKARVSALSKRAQTVSEKSESFIVQLLARLILVWVTKEEPTTPLSHWLAPNAFAQLFNTAS